MGIEVTHPYYDQALPNWIKVRDSYQGSDRIKFKGKTYLPKLDGQSSDEYNEYKLRAVYFNAVERTVQGLIGAVMRVEPIIQVPPKMDEWLDDITNTGVSLTNFISYMLGEQLLTNRQGTLVDYDERPYLVGYATEQITNWATDVIVLKESYAKIDLIDPYLITYEIQYRELKMLDGVYIVNIWRQETGLKNKAGSAWKITDTFYPEIKGKPLVEIPFIPLSDDGFNLVSSTSTLIPLADMTLSLYRTSADLEHGRHFTALPTPYVTGVGGQTNTPPELSIGSGTAWILPEVATKVGFLEFTGQGLTALENAVKEKKEMMASLGSQMLQSSKAGVETADAVRLRQNAEASTLISTVKIVEKGIEKALQLMADWEGITGDISVKLNTDFVDSKITSNDLTAYVSAWQAGAISQDTFLYNMAKGEMLDPDTDIETEKDKISVENVNLE